MPRRRHYVLWRALLIAGAVVLSIILVLAIGLYESTRVPTHSQVEQFFASYPRSSSKRVRRDTRWFFAHFAESDSDEGDDEAAKFFRRFHDLYVSTHDESLLEGLDDFRWERTSDEYAGSICTIIVDGLLKDETFTGHYTKTLPRACELLICADPTRVEDPVDERVVEALVRHTRSECIPVWTRPPW